MGEWWASSFKRRRAALPSQERGFPVCLYLDAAEQKYVEEFSTSNFLGITADGVLVTPTSPSILPSCTKAVVLQARPPARSGARVRRAHAFATEPSSAPPPSARPACEHTRRARGRVPSERTTVASQAAADMGIRVEPRPVPWEEVAALKEVAACGTAVVLTPLSSITRGEQRHTFKDFPTISRLYNAVIALQLGEADDTHGYTKVVGTRAHDPPL